jgi:hypothetical protein
MNPSADTQIIYPGIIVAQVSPVQEVDKSRHDNFVMCNNPKTT